MYKNYSDHQHMIHTPTTNVFRDIFADFPLPVPKKNFFTVTLSKPKLTSPSHVPIT